MEHKGTVFINTNRLCLRQFTENDSQYAFTNWMSDTKVTEYLRWKPHESVAITNEVLAKWIEHYNDKTFYQWAIVLKEIDQPIGTISVVSMDEKTSRIHVGYCLGSKWWGKGYMSESLSSIISFFFEEVNAKRIESQHDPRNVGSGRVMQKCGMKFEGILRNYDWSNQGIVDAVVYAVLAEDYVKMK